MPIQKKFNIKMRDMKNTGVRIPKSYIMLGLQFGVKKNDYRDKEIPDNVAKDIIKNMIKDFSNNDQLSNAEKTQEVQSLKVLLS